MDVPDIILNKLNRLSSGSPDMDARREYAANMFIPGAEISGCT